MKDHMVEEVRKVRERQAARFKFDPREIVEDARKRQTKSGRRIVSFAKPAKRTEA
jgi:hypothetical protein